MSRQSRQAMIILVAVFVVVTPIALILINEQIQLRGASVLPLSDQQFDTEPTAEPNPDNPDTPPDVPEPLTDSGGESVDTPVPPENESGDSDGGSQPTAAPPTPVPPVVQPTQPATAEATAEAPVVQPENTAPPATLTPEVTDLPASQPEATEDATAAPESQTETTPEVVLTPEVTDEAPVEAELTPEATFEPELTPEATLELELTPEATPEIELTPEVTEEASFLQVAAACAAWGTEFVVTNIGGDMSAPEPYQIDDGGSGEILLAAGESVTILASYGSPVFSAGGLTIQPETPCLHPPEFEVTAECTLETGVVFSVMNSGGSMAAPEAYTIEYPDREAITGSIQLGEGETTPVQAGYGAPKLIIGELITPIESRCDAPAEVQGLIWQDTNGDGLRTEDEPGIAGVTVTLSNDEGLLLETTSTEAGFYRFYPVTQGLYSVQTRLETLPPDMQPTYDPDGGNDSTVHLDVAGEPVYSADFGYQPIGTASISGFIWLETGNFGVHDPNETGINGVTVQLIDAAGVTAAETTLAPDGSYRFDQVRVGSYIIRVVRETLPQPFGVTFESDGSADLDTTVAVESGQNVESISFGIVGTF